MMRMRPISATLPRRSWPRSARLPRPLRPGGARQLQGALRLLKDRLDLAIYKAAGLGETGCPQAHQLLIKTVDLRLLATERTQLLGRSPRPWAPAIEQAEPLRVVGKLTPWPWIKAADEYRERLHRYLPGRTPGASSPQPRPRVAACPLRPGPDAP